MIVPWCVDVPQERWPVVNWLIVVAAIVVFVLQSAEFTQAASEPMPATDSSTVPGITGALMLNGWNFTGLFGHIWIHGDLMHLLGNMWFLWIFGNAVCAKVGNLRYLVLYVLLGTTAGVNPSVARFAPGPRRQRRHQRSRRHVSGAVLREPHHLLLDANPDLLAPVHRRQLLDDRLLVVLGHRRRHKGRLVGSVLRASGRLRSRFRRGPVHVQEWLDRHGTLREVTVAMVAAAEGRTLSNVTGLRRTIPAR